MKKLLFLFSMLALVLAVAGCGKKEAPKEKEESPVVYVTPSEIIKKFDNKETFTFVIGSETCSACQNYKADALTKMKEKDGIKLPYIDIYGIEGKEKEFADIQTLIEKNLDNKFEATPTSYFVEKGKLKNVIVGNIPYEKIKKEYDKNQKAAK